MVNILLLNDDFAIGGSQTYIVKLSNELIKKKYNVTICARMGISLKKVSPQIKLVDLPLNKRFVFSIIRSILSISKILKDGEYHIIHCNALIPCVVAKIAVSLSNKNIPIIFTVHKIWEKDSRFPKSILLFMPYLILRLCADQLIVLNELSFNTFSQKGFKNLTMIFNGIESLQAEFYEKENKTSWNIAFIGRLVKQKRIDYIAEISNIIRDKNIHIDVYGDGPEKKKLLKLIDKYKLSSVLQYHGSSSRIDEVFDRADFLIITSEWEGISYSMLEALKYNVPIVGFEVAGVRDVVKNGVNGILVKFGDIKDLAEKIEKIVMDIKRYNLLRAGCKTVLTKYFSLEKMVYSTERIYHKAIR